MDNVSSLPPARQNKVMTPCRHLVRLVSRAVPSLILFLEQQILKTGSERRSRPETTGEGDEFMSRTVAHLQGATHTSHLGPSFCPLARSPVQSWPVRNQFTSSDPQLGPFWSSLHVMESLVSLLFLFVFMVLMQVSFFRCFYSSYFAFICFPSPFCSIYFYLPLYNPAFLYPLFTFGDTFLALFSVFSLALIFVSV